MTEYNTFILQMMLRNANLEMKVSALQKKVEELQYKNQELDILVGYLKDSILEYDPSALNSLHCRENLSR